MKEGRGQSTTEIFLEVEFLELGWAGYMNRRGVRRVERVQNGFTARRWMLLCKGRWK